MTSTPTERLWHSVKPFAHSSVVGGGSMLLSEKGQCVGIVAVLNVIPHEKRVEFETAINEALTIGSAVPSPDFWTGLGKDPELKRARQRLSMHELRQIYRHAIGSQTATEPPLTDIQRSVLTVDDLAAKYLAKVCLDRCQYAIDVSMPEYRCALVCKYREQVCSACGGEGRLYGGHSNDPDPVDLGVCERCDGDGYERIEREEIVPETDEEIKF